MIYNKNMMRRVMALADAKIAGSPKKENVI